MGKLVDKVVVKRNKKPKQPAPVVEPVWLDVSERSFRAYKDTEGNESVMVTHVANSVSYRLWLSLLKAPDRSNKYWRDHSGNEPTPADVTEFLNRADELVDTRQIKIRPKGRYFETIGIEPAAERQALQ